VPLVRSETLRRLLDASREGVAVLTAELPDPSGYGRIVRDGGRVARIVEQKDATEAERAIREVNAGFFALNARRLAGWLSRLKNDNAQKEYYLTDIVGLAVAEGVPVTAIKVEDQWEVAGVNSKQELATLERVVQGREARRLLESGVTLSDPARVDIRGRLECGRDVAIDVNCLFEGSVRLGDGVRIGPNCVLRNVSVAAGTVVHPFSLLEDAEVGANCRIGPYARLRPGAHLAQDVHIGNFVEIKEAVIETGAKANHLSYIGDATVGAGANVGAGTITCNYDGAAKHRTEIGKNAFIGSNSALVAPVKIGEGAYIGSGSVITRDVPADALAIGRGRQVVKEGWARRSRDPKSANKKRTPAT
jgi:bifunctional UDP-N-acetylglucosamine pyrophosphorylase/glucosamine-1-phosphate N-acetyltransferase